MDRYQKQLRSLLSPRERRVFEGLKTPQQIQDYLDSFPANVLGQGKHSMRSPREVMRVRKAHCMEGALLAAASLAYHGREALLMDLQSTDEDEDHVVCLFTENGRWGAISKTNHPVLRWRDPVYASVRELAMSFFHEYAVWWRDKNRGKKTMRAYSKPFDVKKYPPARWVVDKGDLDWLAEALDSSPHSPVAKNVSLKKLRSVAPIEMRAMKLEEWKGRKKVRN